MHLPSTAQRVLGCLVEKALTTPQQYPLSLNALRTACNQSTNRDPVVDYSEEDVRDGLDALKAAELVLTRYASGSRVPKYAHRLEEQLNLRAPDQAVLALLLLRGPQTVGELRGRSERMHAFGDLSEVEDVVRHLAEHPYLPMVAALPRAPGEKQIRHAHLLGADPTPVTDAEAADATVATAGTPHDGELRARVARLEQEVADLREQVASLRALQ